MVLGTMPSVVSIQEAFYYAHPRNAFWPIMSHLTGYPVDSIEDKVSLVKQAKLVLWDVLDNCQRQGSLDSDIKTPKANDFEWLFKQYPQIKTVVFNGQKAAQLFQRHVIKKQHLPEDLELIVLPSTSPANAALKFADKQLFWQEKLSGLV